MAAAAEPVVLALDAGGVLVVAAGEINPDGMTLKADTMMPGCRSVTAAVLTPPTLCASVCSKVKAGAEEEPTADQAQAELEDEYV